MTKEKEMGRRKFVAGTIAAGVVAGTNLLASEKTEVIRPLHGQTALVTGGARGIGRACAIELAKMGANIVIFDLPEPIKSVKYKLSTQRDMDESLKLVRAEGVKASGYKVDVRNLNAVKKGFEKALAEFGKIQIVVPNAGVQSAGTVTQSSEETWQDLIDVNLTGAYHTIQVAARHMVEEKYGRIIAIGSIAARSVTPNSVAYSASKWGLVGLIKATALDLGRSGITANVVNMTMTETGISYSVFPEAATKHLMKVAHITNDTFLEASESARMVAFLAMKESANISGINFDITAGQNARWP